MKRIFKNLFLAPIVSRFLLVSILVGVQAHLSFANPQNLSSDNLIHKIEESSYYFLIDADSKEILLSRNADLRMAPSSMTKLMTALVVFDQVKKGKVSLDNQCLIGKDAWRKSGSSMFLNYGDVVSIDDLVRGLLAVSANDAAIALAESVGGGIANFTNLMNEKAIELGMKNSNFTNPHGLHESNHYSTLRDLATLIIHLYEYFPEYASYFAIPEFTYQNITQRNRNPLIKNNYEGTIIGKTGHTNEGGYGVVELVQRNNRRLVAVVNKVRTPALRAKIITAMMDYGFASYKKLEIFKKDQEIANLKTWLGNEDYVKAVIKEDVTLNVPQQYSIKDLNVEVKYKEPIYAPIKKDTKIADLIIEIKGFKKYEYELFAQQTIEKVGYIRKVSTIVKYKFTTFFNKYFN
ncbi:D-alanyl-D-alanine carboxypeptidase [Alphaproteobacteria bacterium]|nr:D-alanyl-D-alanine carboxypeptidase [Alphaproteobacteria bacterium]